MLVVADAKGQNLAYVYFDDEPQRRAAPSGAFVSGALDHDATQSCLEQIMSKGTVKCSISLELAFIEHGEPRERTQGPKNHMTGFSGVICAACISGRRTDTQFR